MFKYIVLIAVIACLEVLPVRSDQGRIVGGTEADITNFPYQVALIRDDYFQCGGSILSETWILTATHCVDGWKVEYLSVLAGVTNLRDRSGQQIKVQEVHQNPNFTMRWVDYDIALLRLKKPLTFGPKVYPVKLAEAGFEPEPNSEVTISGWGRTDVDNVSLLLRKVTLSIVAHEDCVKQYDTLDQHPKVTPRMICFGNRDGSGSCQGDSGGPVVNSNQVQVGIVSWAYGCGKPGFPGVGADVSALRYYIKDITGL